MTGSLEKLIGFYEWSWNSTGVPHRRHPKRHSISYKDAPLAYAQPSVSYETEVCWHLGHGDYPGTRSIWQV